METKPTGDNRIVCPDLKKFQLNKIEQNNKIIRQISDNGAQLNLGIHSDLVRGFRLNKYNDDRIDLVFTKTNELLDLFRSIQNIVLSKIKAEDRPCFKPIFDVKEIGHNECITLTCSFANEVKLFEKLEYLILNFSSPVWTFKNKIGLLPSAKLIFRIKNEDEIKDVFID